MTPALGPDPELSSAHAFGEGADARLAGRPVDANPYGQGAEKCLRVAWDSGWRHVHRSWGCDVGAGWWAVRPLPRVDPGRF
jgi:hypothetical protein